MKRAVCWIGLCWLWASGTSFSKDSGATAQTDASQPEALPRVTGLAADIQRAARITGQGLLAALAQVRPERAEGDIAEVLVRAIARESDEALAFEPIVGAGENSVVLHHHGGARRFAPGELLVLDVGARYRGACADLTRTLPISGRFSARQRQIYDLVLDAQQAAARQIRPGTHSLDQLTDFVRDFFRQSPLRSRDRNGALRTLDAFFEHAVGHYIGREVHGEDLGLDTSRPLQSGQVISIEPGLYLESEGFGIRIEDDYLVTDSGVVNLLPTLPKTAAEIEKLMATAPIPFYEAAIAPDFFPLFVPRGSTLRARLRA